MSEDKACQNVESELIKAINEISKSNFGEKVQSLILFRKVHCGMIDMKKFCKENGMDNKLMQPVVKIFGNKEDFNGWIYPFTSPYKQLFFNKKILSFTIPKFVMPIGNDLNKLKQFPEVRSENGIVFALQCDLSQVNTIYNNLAQVNKEKYYFFSLDTSQQSTCIFYSVFKDKTNQVDLTSSKSPQKDIEQFIKDSLLEDIPLWSLTQHAQNSTFQQAQNSLIILGLVGRDTEVLSSDFLQEFRAFYHFYEYDKRYSIYLLDTDHIPSFIWLTTLNIGRFDTPGIVAISNLTQGIIYRNYQTYNGDNFQNISHDLIKDIKSGTKRVLYTQGIKRILNAQNYEYWLNNLLQFYTLSIGLVSIIIIPILLLIDCFIPILGRGPNQRKLQQKVKEGKTAEEEKQNKVEQEEQSKQQKFKKSPLKESKKNR